MARADSAWDLLVLGGGTAGIVAAKTAAGLGGKVLLIEAARTGGDCLWTGCVPSKSILAASHAIAIARKAVADFGGSLEAKIEFSRVMDYVHSAINEIEPEDSPAALASFGIKVMQGHATFTGLHSIAVDGVEHRFRKAVIATGAEPAIPPIPGLRQANYLTSESIWELQELPRRFAILGAGSIGAELGQAFARLGSEVTLIDGAERILPREDEIASKILTDKLASEGVRVITSAKVRSINSDPSGSGAMVLDTPAGSDLQVNFDRVLIAIGRKPRTANLGLNLAGVALDKSGYVVTSESLRTSNRDIWAAGDVTGHPQFTHVAGVHGSTAASNAVLGLSRRAESRVIPRVTFTDPEVASVGVATNTKDSKYRVLELAHAEVDRAITESQHGGATKLVVDAKGKIVGGLSIGPRAGELLAEVTLAIKMGLTTRNIASTMHPYPTYGDGLWNIAIADLRRQLGSPRVQLVLSGLRKFTKVRTALSNKDER